MAECRLNIPLWRIPQKFGRLIQTIQPFSFLAFNQINQFILHILSFPGKTLISIYRTVPEAEKEKQTVQNQEEPKSVPSGREEEQRGRYKQQEEPRSVPSGREEALRGRYKKQEEPESVPSGKKEERRGRYASANT